MGCDIHGHIEGAYKDSTDWELIALGELCLPRDYVLFGALAGVRDNSIVPVVPPRGSPKDGCWVCDPEAGDPHFDLGDHTFSWLTLDEVEEAERRMKAVAPDDPTGLEVVLAVMRASRDAGYETRFVFGFSS